MTTLYFCIYLLFLFISLFPIFTRLRFYFSGVPNRRERSDEVEVPGSGQNHLQGGQAVAAEAHTPADRIGGGGGG
jgi:hypothetical protein